ncbi:MAG: GntP family permease, partial [Bacteroidota bacterium]
MLPILLLLFSVGLIILLTARFDVHPFLALLAAALSFGLLSGMDSALIIQSINDGFGGILGKIGLVILFGVIIGSFLEHSGGAFKLAELVLRIIGRKRVHAAMAIIGYIVSIPVFADSGFIILNPLNKSLTKRAKLSFAGTGVALILGLMLSHTMVPPTPGPIAAAGYIGADLGLVMLMGIGVSALSLIPAIYYASRYASKVYIDPNPDMSEEQINEKIKQAPSAFRSFLPILVPILLIITASIIESSLSIKLGGEGEAAPQALWHTILLFLGQPVIALTVGMLLAFFLPRKLDRSLFSNSGLVGKSLVDASTILLITGAGGIFGKILQNSGITDILADNLAGLSLGIWLPFILAAAIKTAQGSSTVALITTASILGGSLA